GCRNRDIKAQKMADDFLQRAAVIAAARSWVGTPYHHHGRVKGVGADCATLLAEVYAEAGLRPRVELGYYSPQWHLNQERPLYEETVLGNGAVRTDRPSIGDVVLYRQSSSRRRSSRAARREFQFAHGAILVDSSIPRIIHAYAALRCVLE